MTGSGKGRWVAFAFLCALGVFWVFPIVWQVLNSFKYDSDFITSFARLQGPWDYLTRLVPKRFTVSNYIEIFTGGGSTNTASNMLAMIKNSFIVSISTTALVVVIASLSAYAYERLDFPGGNAIFWTLLCMSMFPNVVNVLPMFRIMTGLRWTDNLNALIWPAMAGVFNIFLLRNFLKGVPRDYDEAARIDGANSMQIYARVILPMMRPVLIVVGLFAFNGSWNDFLWPSIVMTDVSKQTLTAGLRLLQGQYDGYWAHLIASCLVSMVPPFLLYLIAQRYFLQGITIQGGVKG